MKIKAIRPAGRADVYNMEVDGTHDFAVESGVIVHNCYDECRYVLMANPIAARKPAEVKAREYNPLDTDVDYDRYERYAFYRK